MVAADLAPGETINEGGGRLLVVRNGRARVMVPGVDGQWTPVADLFPGDSFGVGALLGQERGAMLQAYESARVLVLGDDALALLAGQFPTVGAALEGRSAPAAAPAGGHRLSRVTFAVSKDQARQLLQAAPAAAAPSPDEAEVRRLTGAFKAVR
jgi:CRP-like cAMP-binding protein